MPPAVHSTVTARHHPRGRHGKLCTLRYAPPSPHNRGLMMSRQRQWTIALGCGLGLALLAATTIAAAQGQSSTLQLVQQNNSGISGTATFTPSGGGLTVDLMVTGAGAGPQPAHIHGGTCAQLNPTPEFTLASVTNGASTTTLQTTLQS